MLSNYSRLKKKPDYTIYHRIHSLTNYRTHPQCITVFSFDRLTVCDTFECKMFELFTYRKLRKKKHKDIDDYI